MDGDFFVKGWNKGGNPRALLTSTGWILDLLLKVVTPVLIYNIKS